MNMNIVCKCEKNHKAPIFIKVTSIKEKEKYDAYMNKAETVNKGIEILLDGTLPLPESDNSNEITADIYFKVSLFINENNINSEVKIPYALLERVFGDDTSRVIGIVKNLIENTSKLVDAILEQQIDEFNFSSGDFYGKENIENVISIINEKIANLENN